MLERVWSILISLKLAVFVIAGLAITLATATILESKYDTATAQYFVYRSAWFYGVLVLLGLNILAVAISRLPWKKKHIPFLMAHAGILMILVGSWITATQGLDGSIRISEGEVNSAVELDEHLLALSKGDRVETSPFPWMPASAAKNFKPKAYSNFGLKIERIIPDAEAKVQFISASQENAKAAPAIQIRILGSPMGGAPELWLWSGDPGWAMQKLGPARFLVRREGRDDLSATAATAGAPESEARLDFIAMKDGSLRYEATSLRGEKKSGKINLNETSAESRIVNPGWRMPIQVQVKQFLPHALNQTEYEPVKPKASGMGSSMPNPAIKISLLNNPASQLWLGLGDRAEFFDIDGQEVSVGYFPKRVMLPFAVRLKEFEMKTNPGTMDPAAYSSYVQVVQDFKKSEAELNALPVEHITMNEPLKAEKYTLYQASYIPEFPRPTTTILSVNYDPGRTLKYTGSLLLVAGAIFLYLVKIIKRKPPKESAA